MLETSGTQAFSLHKLGLAFGPEVTARKQQGEGEKNAKEAKGQQKLTSPASPVHEKPLNPPKTARTPDEPRLEPFNLEPLRFAM